MEHDGADRPQQLQDEDSSQLSDFNVHGARNFSKMKKLESARTHTTTSRSVTTNNAAGATRYANGDMERSSSPEIMIDDDLQQRTYDEWRRSRSEQRSEMKEQDSDTQVKRRAAEDRCSAAREQRSAAKEPEHPSQSLNRRERNVAAAEMAYRMVGLPTDIEVAQVSKRSKSASSSGGHSKTRGGVRGLEQSADMIVEDAMEEAIEAMYGKKRRRKMAGNVRSSSSGDTRVLDRSSRIVDREAMISYYDTVENQNRALNRTINETTSKDDSRKKAVSYLRVQNGDQDVGLNRPASADGRLINRAAHRRALAAERLANVRKTPRSRLQATCMSPIMSQQQRRATTNMLASRRVGGYSSETELMQSASRPDRRHHFSGADDSYFSTTVEVRSPHSERFQADNSGNSSDESETRNGHSRVPTLTKGMVTKILHGERPQKTESFVSELRRPDVQSATSPVQFTSSPPPSFTSSLPLRFHGGSQLSAIVPVGTGSRSSFQQSAVDDNFLLQRAPAYHQRMGSAQYFSGQPAAYGGGGTGRSTPTSARNEEWPPTSYVAFSNEPIIVANLDNDDNHYAAEQTSMRRTRSVFELDQLSPASTSLARSQSRSYHSSRPDIRMTNRQVLNLYLFNKRIPPGEGGNGRAVEMETVTRTIAFDDDRMTKETRTQRQSPTHQGPKTKQNSKSVQADTQLAHPKLPQRRQPKSSSVTEETVIMKPSFTETRETEIVGDVFADRHRMSSSETETPAVRSTRSLVTAAHQESPQEEPEEEEEILETTVVEEKEQRIEMTIREDLEFSLQRSRGTGKTVAGTEEGRVEPWWIPDTFEALVERKRQKTTQTKDIENKDDHSKRIDIETVARSLSANYQEAVEKDNFEDGSNQDNDSGDENSGQIEREVTRNVRIPIFLESRYNSPMHGMTSPSASLVRTKMATHSEPELSRRNQYYLAKRDKYYESLFDDSRRKPQISAQSSNAQFPSVQSPGSHKRQHKSSSADVSELHLKVVDADEAYYDSKSSAQKPRPAEGRYVSSYSQYISPPPSRSGENQMPTVAAGIADMIISRSDAAAHVTPQPATSRTRSVFRTSKTVSLPNVELERGDCQTQGRENDHHLSMDHFDRVLTEIEEELPAPPPPPPLPPANQHIPHTTSQTQAPRASTSQHHYMTSSPAMPSADTHKKSKPPPTPEKSWKRSDPPLPRSEKLKLYSSQNEPVYAAVGCPERQNTSSERQSASVKEMSTTSSGRQQATGSDFRHELCDNSYVSLSLTEPIQGEDQRRKTTVATQDHAAPGGFRYGCISQEQKKQRIHERQPGSYQLRHSRWQPAETYETAATAF